MNETGSQGGGQASQGAPAPQPIKEKNTLMGILSYLGPFVLVSFALAKDDPYVKFHIKQGLVLLVIEVGLWVIASTLWMLIPIIGLLNIGVLVLSIIGIINAVNGKETQLPLVGSFAKHFTF